MNKHCDYCGITQDELYAIVNKRGGNLTQNGGQKRSKGTLEIEQKEAPEQGKKYKDLSNLVLACPLCNNAKSNLIDENSWRELFASPIRTYYERQLGKELALPLSKDSTK